MTHYMNCSDSPTRIHIHVDGAMYASKEREQDVQDSIRIFHPMEPSPPSLQPAQKLALVSSRIAIL